jgi:hypothetical protein
MLLFWFLSEQLIAADKGEFSAHSPGRLVDDKLLLLLLLWMAAEAKGLAVAKRPILRPSYSKRGL